MKDARYTVVEKAGYEGEQDITSFPNWQAAAVFLNERYDTDERDPLHRNCLHVAIRQDWTDEETGEEMSEYIA